MDAQLHTTAPLRKRLWKQIVQAKINAQAVAIAYFGESNRPLQRMASKVRSGDPSNIDGQAARLYWKLLFGESFRRDRDAPGANAMLNYGYTVLRAVVARQVMAAGLHPGIPLHHANESNAMRLVDDLMEPFRPLVDVCVRKLIAAGRSKLDAGTRRELAILGTRSALTAYGMTTVSTTVQRLAASLAHVCEAGTGALELPVWDTAALGSLWGHVRGTQQDNEDE